jgi:hypothetical protein
MRAKPHVRPLLLVLAALTAALASVLGGCSGGAGSPVAGGPLSSRGANGVVPRGSYCGPARVGQPIAFGEEVFTNYGHTTVVLDRVSLQHPRNERLIGSYVIEGGSVLIGAEYWPPSVGAVASTWKLRKPVRGFRLAPGKSFNMVLGVIATATGQAKSQGMLVYYHDSAGSYVTSDDFAMVIAVNKAQCP